MHNIEASQVQGETPFEVGKAAEDLCSYGCAAGLGFMGTAGAYCGGAPPPWLGAPYT
jgi:hypothetical protein